MSGPRYTTFLLFYSHFPQGTRIDNTTVNTVFTLVCIDILIGFMFYPYLYYCVFEMFLDFAFLSHCGVYFHIKLLQFVHCVFQEILSKAYTITYSRVPNKGGRRIRDFSD